ncbi:sensor histidine kinase [Polaribacter reichenbachii]|uniref:histidine kinase n=1 Tax=Polaribacter reichenbachii TaxID=996801 RepID=A0A1B8TNP5_9FLAO|nr:ATP-binding protein [Polaribacter reichenbachii]APZ46689.1 sensor histidine kinase [Polaribacter reichenbachii]AUC17332.1 sensor histidine kinase [Polaribacter reichenbachii]OBY61219.1 hypothetical protein LPB301_17255 [Polaribacter reichenbachii]
MKTDQIKEIEDLLLANKKLKEENFALNRQNKDLKQFSYLATHDLQQPINNIISYLSILEDSRKNLDDLGNLCLTVIKKSSFKMKSFITSLLEYSLIGNNPKDEYIVIADVIESVKEVLSDKIEESNATININLKEHQLYCYKNDIHLLFLHLIENALKFSKENETPEITIKSEIKDENYVYSISDKGIGIEEVHFKNIFDIFYTINRDEKYEGVGIGLADCKKIIELYKGKIWLESTINKGSTFFFTLPKA